MSRKEHLANMVDSLVKQDAEAATSAFKAAVQEMGREIMNPPQTSPKEPEEPTSGA